MKYYIITGASRGIGNAVARKLLLRGNSLICISRMKEQGLISEALKTGVELRYLCWDLNDVYNIENLAKRIFSEIDKDSAEGIYLINNAAVLEPVMPLEKCGAEQIIRSINTNLAAPMVLCALFLKETEGMQVPRRVVNLSSGAARKPYHGWSCYCATKAGIDHFTRCVGLEQSRSEKPAIVFTFTPGVVDTGMQDAIRKANSEDFPDRDRFISFADEGRLLGTDFVAEAVIKLLHSADTPQGAILDIREMNMSL